MEKLYSNVIGSPIFEGDSPTAFSTVKDIVMDPENGKMLALVVNLKKNLIITPMDIFEWKMAIKIHNHDVVTEAEDVLRVAEVQKGGIKILNNKVETEGGDAIGKVFDFTVDSDAGHLVKIYVAKTHFGLFRGEAKIISTKHIVEIKKGKIVVKSGLSKIKEEEKAVVKDMAVS